MTPERQDPISRRRCVGVLAQTCFYNESSAFWSAIKLIGFLRVMATCTRGVDAAGRCAPEAPRLVRLVSNFCQNAKSGICGSAKSESDGAEKDE